MKKLILLHIACCFLLPAVIEAQTSKGRVMLGISSRYGFSNSDGGDLLSLGYSTQKYESDNPYYYGPEKSYSTSFNFIPRMGYLLMNNFVLGLDYYISFSRSNYFFNPEAADEDDYFAENLVYGFGPFARYYFPLKRVKPFAEAGVMLGRLENTTDYVHGMGSYNELKQMYNLFSITGGAGTAFVISDKVTFDLMAGYSSFTQKNRADQYNDRTITGTIGLRFGVTVYLGKNKAKE